MNFRATRVLRQFFSAASAPVGPSAFAVVLVSGLLLLPLGGCKKTVSDATLTGNVQKTLAADPSLANQPVQGSVQNGVVTLTGNVTDDSASSVAAEDTAKIAGVKEVVNDITVNGIAVAPTITSPAAPENPQPATAQEQTEIAEHQPLPPPPDHAPPPPAPSFRDVTVPAGSEIHVRINQTLDSARTEVGTPFNGVVTHPVVVDGMVAVDAGSEVSGAVVDVHDAGHFKGHSLLALRLTSLRHHDHTIAISTDDYTVEGANRGRNTAEKVGGGAVIGAVLGGIFGGGKGAAIGAAAGGGAGAATQGFTRGQEVEIPSETHLHFQVRSPFTVHTSERPSNDEPPPGLQHR